MRVEVGLVVGGVEGVAAERARWEVCERRVNEKREERRTLREVRLVAFEEGDELVVEKEESLDEVDETRDGLEEEERGQEPNSTGVRASSDALRGEWEGSEDEVVRCCSCWFLPPPLDGI